MSHPKNETFIIESSSVEGQNVCDIPPISTETFTIDIYSDGWINSQYFTCSSNSFNDEELSSESVECEPHNVCLNPSLEREICERQAVIDIDRPTSVSDSNHTPQLNAQSSFLCNTYTVSPCDDEHSLNSHSIIRNGSKFETNGACGSACNQWHEPSSDSEILECGQRFTCSMENNSDCQLPAQITASSLNSAASNGFSFNPNRKLGNCAEPAKLPNILEECQQALQDSTSFNTEIKIFTTNNINSGDSLSSPNRMQVLSKNFNFKGAKDSFHSQVISSKDFACAKLFNEAENVLAQERPVYLTFSQDSLFLSFSPSKAFDYFATKLKESNIKTSTQREPSEGMTCQVPKSVSSSGETYFSPIKNLAESSAVGPEQTCHTVSSGVENQRSATDAGLELDGRIPDAVCPFDESQLLFMEPCDEPISCSQEAELLILSGKIISTTLSPEYSRSTNFASFSESLCTVVSMKPKSQVVEDIGKTCNVNPPIKCSAIFKEAGGSFLNQAYLAEESIKENENLGDVIEKTPPRQNITCENVAAVVCENESHSETFSRNKDFLECGKSSYDVTGSKISSKKILRNTKGEESKKSPLSLVCEDERSSIVVSQVKNANEKCKTLSNAACKGESAAETNSLFKDSRVLSLSGETLKPLSNPSNNKMSSSTTNSSSGIIESSLINHSKSPVITRSKKELSTLSTESTVAKNSAKSPLKLGSSLKESNFSSSGSGVVVESSILNQAGELVSSKKKLNIPLVREKRLSRKKRRRQFKKFKIISRRKFLRTKKKSSCFQQNCNPNLMQTTVNLIDEPVEFVDECCSSSSDSSSGSLNLSLNCFSLNDEEVEKRPLKQRRIDRKVRSKCLFESEKSFHRDFVTPKGTTAINLAMSETPRFRATTTRKTNSTNKFSTSDGKASETIDQILQRDSTQAMKISRLCDLDYFCLNSLIIDDHFLEYHGLLPDIKLHKVNFRTPKKKHKVPELPDCSVVLRDCMKRESDLSSSAQPSKKHKLDSPLSLSINQKLESSLSPTTRSSNNQKLESSLSPTTRSSQNQKLESSLSPTTRSSKNQKLESSLSPTPRSSKKRKLDPSSSIATLSSKKGRLNPLPSPSVQCSKTHKPDSSPIKQNFNPSPPNSFSFFNICLTRGSVNGKLSASKKDSNVQTNMKVLHSEPLENLRKAEGKDGSTCNLGMKNSSSCPSDVPKPCHSNGESTSTSVPASMHYTTVKACLINITPSHPENFVSAACLVCKNFTPYLIAEKEHVSFDSMWPENKVPVCSSQKCKKRTLHLGIFRVKLLLKVDNGVTILATVKSPEAEYFFGCSVREFISNDELQRKIKGRMTQLLVSQEYDPDNIIFKNYNLMSRIKGDGKLVKIINTNLFEP